MDTDIHIATGCYFAYLVIVSPLRRWVPPSLRPFQFHRENRHGEYRFGRERRG
jgi:hypothetical protein